MSPGTIGERIGWHDAGPGEPLVQPVDLADLDRSIGVLPAGVSGNPASPHWSDQFPLWIAGEHHPLPFTRPAVEAAAVATLRLLPG